MQISDFSQALYLSKALQAVFKVLCPTAEKKHSDGHKNKNQEKLQSNLDSTWVLIGLQVCFHNAMKHENGVSNMV